MQVKLAMMCVCPLLILTIVLRSIWRIVTIRLKVRDGWRGYPVGRTTRTFRVYGPAKRVIVEIPLSPHRPQVFVTHT